MSQPALEVVAKAVAARENVDWREIEAATPDSDSVALIRELHVVAEIANFHRSPVTQGAPSGETFHANTWGSLRVIRSIGSGSFGDVYEAYDPALDRVVALKLLRDSDWRRGIGTEAIEEGRVLARVRHAHVVTVFGAARLDGRAGIWMEFIEGHTLAHPVADRGSMAAREAASVVRDVCLGLAAVHEAGIVHRDVKAQNVMQDRNGRVVLMDLGASLDGAEISADVMAGTPAYLAPELLDGGPATPQSDIYSVGVLLFHLTTGVYPVSGASFDEVRRRHGCGDRLTLRDAGARLPRALAEIVERSLAESPSDRFATAREMAEALDRFLRGRNRRAGVAVAATFAVTAAIVAAVLWMRSPPPSSAEGTAARRLILVGAFENHTGKSIFDRTIQAGLEYELSRAALPVAPSIRVDDALKLLGKPIDSPLSPTLAHEVAQRDRGIQTLIVGSIDMTPHGEVIRARVIDSTTSAVQAVAQAEVTSDALAPEALRQLALDLQERLGRAPASSERVGPTISLESLLDYSAALRLGTRGDWQGALADVRRVVSRDRAFAMAQAWLAWCEFHTQAQNDALRTAAVAEAEAQDPGVPAHEREWILGSAADLRGDNARALLHFEAALTAKPDDVWTANRLALLYDQSGAHDRAVAMATEAANLRPNDFHQQAFATRWLLRAGRDAGQVAEYDGRALGLLDAEAARSHRVDAAFALLVPAELAWRTRDPVSTAAALASVASDPRLLAAAELANSVWERVSVFHLAMGQVAAARGVIGRIGPIDDRELLLAIADSYGDDLRLAQQHLDRVCNPRENPQAAHHFPACTELLIQAGRLDDAEALQKQAQATWDSVNLRASVGELAAARSHADDAIRILPGTIDRLNPESGQYFSAVRALSDAWLAKHEREAAISALRSGLSRSPNPSDPAVSLEVAALSVRLAALCRQEGAAADAIEAAAMRGLEHADAGFVDRLRRIATAGIDR